MKLKAVTSAGISFSAGPYISPGQTVDFGDDLPAWLVDEINEMKKKGLVAVVSDAEPKPVAMPVSAAPASDSKKKAGR